MEATLTMFSNIGRFKYQNKTFATSLDIIGQLFFDSCQSQNSVTVKGQFHPTHSILYKTVKIIGQIYPVKSTFKEDLIIDGKIFAKDGSVFEQSVSVRGEFNAEASHFKSNIIFDGINAKLVNTVIDGNFIFKQHSHDKQQVLNLQGSTIKGQVIFEGQQGIIHLDADSKMNSDAVNAITQQLSELSLNSNL
ncbi:MAG: hypothetical protein Tsb005_21460 [Gammaproteobacteria bacterium]